MYTALIFLLTITSTTLAYRNGARNDSCYGHEIVHETFGSPVQPTECTNCPYTLVVAGIVGSDTSGSITTYQCSTTYRFVLNYTRNAFEGFLVQARDVGGDTLDNSSSIYGAFLDDDSYLYKSLNCGRNVNEQDVTFPNSATQKVPVNEESGVELFWRSPEPVMNANDLPESLTFWFTIVQQQQTFFFPIEGPTLARGDSCMIPTMETVTNSTVMVTQTTTVTESTTTDAGGRALSAMTTTGISAIVGVCVAVFFSFYGN